MHLLYVARNITLNGQTNYIDAFIDQPKISDYLLNLKKSNILACMSEEVQKQKDKGTISSEHKPTHGEMAIQRANKLINEHPNAVAIAKQKLKESHYFKVNKR